MEEVEPFIPAVSSACAEVEEVEESIHAKASSCRDLVHEEASKTLASQETCVATAKEILLALEEEGAAECGISRQRTRRLQWLLWLRVIEGEDTTHWQKQVAAHRRSFGKLLEACRGEGSKIPARWRTQIVADIDLDVARCFPELPDFNTQKARAELKDILLAHAEHHFSNDNFAYRQGYHELAAAMLKVCWDGCCPSDSSGTPSAMAELCSEESCAADAWAMFETLLHTYHLADMFEQSDAVHEGGIESRCRRIMSGLRKVDPDLLREISRWGIAPHVLLLRWVRLLFVREFSLQDVFRAWDVIFADAFLNADPHPFGEDSAEWLRSTSPASALAAHMEAKNASRGPPGATPASNALPLADFLALAMILEAHPKAPDRLLRFGEEPCDLPKLLRSASSLLASAREQRSKPSLFQDSPAAVSAMGDAQRPAAGSSAKVTAAGSSQSRRAAFPQPPPPSVTVGAVGRAVAPSAAAVQRAPAFMVAEPPPGSAPPSGEPMEHVAGATDRPSQPPKSNDNSKVRYSLEESFGGYLLDWAAAGFEKLVRASLHPSDPRAAAYTATEDERTQPDMQHSPAPDPRGFGESPPPLHPPGGAPFPARAPDRMLPTPQLQPQHPGLPSHTGPTAAWGPPAPAPAAAAAPATFGHVAETPSFASLGQPPAPQSHEYPTGRHAPAPQACLSSESQGNVVGSSTADTQSTDSGVDLRAQLQALDAQIKSLSSSSLQPTDMPQSSSSDYGRDRSGRAPEPYTAKTLPASNGRPMKGHQAPPGQHLEPAREEHCSEEQAYELLWGHPPDVPLYEEPPFHDPSQMPMMILEDDLDPAVDLKGYHRVQHSLQFVQPDGYAGAVDYKAQAAAVRRATDKPPGAR